MRSEQHILFFIRGVMQDFWLSPILICANLCNERILETQSYILEFALQAKLSQAYCINFLHNMSS